MPYPSSSRVFISRDVIFDETVFPFSELHANAGARLRAEINLLPSDLIPLSFHGAEHVADGVFNSSNTANSAGSSTCDHRDENLPPGARTEEDLAQNAGKSVPGSAPATAADAVVLCVSPSGSVLDAADAPRDSGPSSQPGAATRAVPPTRTAVRQTEAATTTPPGASEGEMAAAPTVTAVPDSSAPGSATAGAEVSESSVPEPPRDPSSCWNSQTQGIHRWDGQVWILCSFW